MNTPEDRIREEKAALRQKMLARRRALSADTVSAWAGRLCANILALPEYRQAHRILAFLAMKGESNLDPFIRAAMAEGKEIYIPVCLPERRMEAGRLLGMDHFEKGPLGLRNLPAGYTAIAPESLDFLLIPAAACGKDGTRLGMGAGYYDRYLTRVPLDRRIAALWDFQLLDTVPAGPYDEKVAAIVTEKRLVRCVP